jgi:hypothetical protein
VIAKECAGIGVVSQGFEIMSVLGKDSLTAAGVLTWLISRDEPSFLPSFHTDKSSHPSP